MSWYGTWDQGSCDTPRRGAPTGEMGFGGLPLDRLRLLAPAVDLPLALPPVLDLVFAQSPNLCLSLSDSDAQPRPSCAPATPPRRTVGGGLVRGNLKRASERVRLTDAHARRAGRLRRPRRETPASLLQRADAPGDLPEGARCQHSGPSANASPICPGHQAVLELRGASTECCTRHARWSAKTGESRFGVLILNRFRPLALSPNPYLSRPLSLLPITGLRARLRRARDALPEGARHNLMPWSVTHRGA